MKDWFFELTLKKIVLLILLGVVLFLIKIYIDKYNNYAQYENRIEAHFNNNYSLLCKDKSDDTRDIVNIKNDWSIAFGVIFQESDWDRAYNLYDCKRLDIKLNIIPNHYYTKLDKALDKNNSSVLKTLWDIETNYIDEIVRLLNDAYRKTNSMHIEEYLEKFNNQMIFECYEEKISKDEGWEIVSSNNILYFTKENKKINIINCDIDYDSPW